MRAPFAIEIEVAGQVEHGTTQSRSPGREWSRVTTLRIPREDALVAPMSLIDAEGGKSAVYDCLVC